MEPNTTGPNTYSPKVRFVFILLLKSGGEIVNHSTQIRTCMRVKARTLSLCCGGPNHFMTSLPGSVALKAISTTIVFPRTQEMQRTKVIPNAVWRSIQDHSEGRPMKVREHRKHRVREKRSRKLSSELLALTIGVSFLIKNRTATSEVRKTPNRAKNTRTIPITSVNDRNSTAFSTHLSLLGLDQYSPGQRSQLLESENKSGLVRLGEQRSYRKWATSRRSAHRPATEP